ncbi:Ldh family oxidoreductase [Streptomyces collinus]|uniref:Ldh family oxidoreductase n=1 Tax=Streptomyces collinus TaxID=42684 RepID=UPI0036B4A211
MKEHVVTAGADSLRQFYAACLQKMGVPKEYSKICADGLIYADINGIATHGASSFNRLYLRMLREGAVNPTARPRVQHSHRAVAIVDGCNSLGFISAEYAMRQAITRAREYGTGAVAVRNSSHCGSMGWYTSLAAQSGLIGIATTNLGGQKILAPPGGKEPLLGTNVLAASAPAASEVPFALDMSTAVVAAGRIRLADQRGEHVPDGWLADELGAPINDPSAYFDGRARLQFLGGAPSTGGYKGYGLAILADILSGLLSGAQVGPSRPTTLPSHGTRADADIGHFLLAIDVTAFRSLEKFTAEMDRMLGTLRTSPGVDDSVPVAYPGLAEERHRNSLAGKLLLPQDLFDELTQVARTLGVPAPQLTVPPPPSRNVIRRASLPVRLRYGLNPHQGSAVASPVRDTLPFTVLNGSPSYLTVLDALTGWCVVRDGKALLRRPVAASIKHAGTNGVATSNPLSEEEARAYRVHQTTHSPIALAYIRARGTDRVAAYGDLVALSEVADESFAKIALPEAINGIIAPGYTSSALEILRTKRNGSLLLLEADEDYIPPALETREVFGVSLRQERDSANVTASSLKPLIHDADLPQDAVENLLIATLAAHYAESNAVCIAYRGQTIAIGAGQPSRIRATRLACMQASMWRLRQHPAVHELQFPEHLTRHETDSAIEEFLLWSELHATARTRLRAAVTHWVPPLGEAARSAWLSGQTDLALASDGPFPFPDSLYPAANIGVRYVAHSGGARRDQSILSTAEELGMTLLTFGNRLFRN